MISLNERGLSWPCPNLILQTLLISHGSPYLLGGWEEWMGFGLREGVGWGGEKNVNGNVK